MAWIQWGETQGETLLMLRTKTQDHEDLLMGNADANIEGVVPTVNQLMAQISAYKQSMIVLNGIIIIGLMLLGAMIQFRTVTAQPAPQSYQPNQKHSYAQQPDSVYSEQKGPQDAQIPTVR